MHFYYYPGLKHQLKTWCLVKNTIFTKTFETLFFSLKCSPFIPKLYTEIRFQIRKIINEIHAFKIFLYGVCMGMSLSQLLAVYYVSHIRENLFMPYANNKGADQPAHPRSLISTFVVRCLDSIISLVSISEISSLLLLASVAVQAGLSLTWSKTPKTGFLVMRLMCASGKSIKLILQYFFFLFSLHYFL